jgi:hypothetical protein
VLRYIYSVENPPDAIELCALRFLFAIVPFLGIYANLKREETTAEAIERTTNQSLNSQIDSSGNSNKAYKYVYLCTCEHVRHRKY